VYERERDWWEARFGRREAAVSDETLIMNAFQRKP
jgi:hypothetical protein